MEPLICTATFCDYDDLCSVLDEAVYEFNESAQTFYRAQGCGTVTRRMGKPL